MSSFMEILLVWWVSQTETKVILVSCVQDGLRLGRAWLLLLYEMQRWLQNSFLRLKLSLYLLSPNTCGNTLAPEGSISLFRKAQGENSKCLSRCSSTQSHSAGPGGKTRVKGWKDLMYLGARQSEKELGKSLYKLRSTRLVILQNVEQLGFTRLQLWDTAWQEQVPNPRGDLGQSGLLSLPRHIQT